MADDFDRIRRFVDNPATRSLLSMAAIAGFFIYAGKRFSTPEGRQSYVDEVKQAVAERRRRDRWRERRDARYRAKLDYFNGRGGELYRERAEIHIGPEAPFPDARYEQLPGGFRGSSFRANSQSASASVVLRWDVADRDGGLKLSLSDGRTWSFGFFAGHSDLHQYAKAPHDFELARLACRLLATPGSQFSTITFVRPDAGEIREQIWRDHVAEHPELADEPWPRPDASSR